MSAKATNSADKINCGALLCLGMQTGNQALERSGEFRDHASVLR